MTVTVATYGEMLNHVSGQIDILNQSVWVTNNYLVFISVCMALLSTLMMFALGYYISKGK